MDAVIIIDWVLRGAAISQLVLSSLIFLRAGKIASDAEKFFPVFALAASCGILWPHFPVTHETTLAYLISGGAGAVGITFWVLVEAIFNDSFRLQSYHWLAVILLISISIFPFLPGRSVVMGLNVVIAMVIIARILQGYAADLIDSRRKARVFLLVSTTFLIAAMSTITIFIALVNKETQTLLNAIGSFFIVAILLVFNCFALRTSEVFLQVPRSKINKESNFDTKSIEIKLGEVMDDGCYKDHGLTVGSLAKKVGTQEYLLRKIINQTLGYRNFNDYLNNYRIAEAKKLLAIPDKAESKIFAIAIEAGFASLAPFNRAFRQIVGCTPSEYRNQLQEKR